MSSAEPTNTGTEKPKEDEGSTSVEGVQSGASVGNGQVEYSDVPVSVGASEPGTPDGVEAGAAVGNDVEVKNGSVSGADASPVEGLPKPDGAVGDDQGGEAGKALVEKEVPEPSSKTLEDADVLFQKGSDALKADDFIEAVDCLSRALEIRVAHYGELAPECASTYYKYGSALLYKAQAEADPLNESVALAKKAEASAKSAKGQPLGSDVKGESSSNGVKGEASEGLANGVKGESPEVLASDIKGKASASNGDGGEFTMEEKQDEVMDDADGQESDGEDAEEDVEGEAEDEEDSDLDLAWKMLDIARVILEKQPCDTIEKVNVISALGDVSLEREDFETSLSDYLRALSTLEGLAAADSRHIAELCFKVCLALQMRNKIPDALHYCRRAISICEMCLQKLTNDVENDTVVKDMQNTPSCNGDIQENALPTRVRDEEIEIIKQLLVDLAEKVEDLQQMMSAPPLLEVVRSVDSMHAAEKKQCFYQRQFLSTRSSRDRIRCP